MKKKLIIFTRYPIQGKAKTRLIPELGKNGAAKLQEIMTGLAVLNSRCFATQSNAHIKIFFDGATEKNMRKWLGRELSFVNQGSGDLGQRMNRAFENAFKSGYDSVVIIGCDCPQLNSEYISSAFDALNDNDMVIGPAFDGGYYLIGIQKTLPELFTNIAWGTESVLEQTITIAEGLNLKVKQLEKLSDIDNPQDLQLCRDIGLLSPGFNDTISVIIPALNEESKIQKTISIATDGAMEIIVADGGSQDNTVKLSQQMGAPAIVVPYGRACQLNFAALKAKGDILLFLHADTFLPKNYAPPITKAIKNPEFIAGAFTLNIDSKRFGIRIIEKMANMRSRILKMPYGDQALFMRKETFLRMGGFANIPIMEDYEFIKRLRCRGTVVTLNEKVETSARRWRKLGVLRTTVVNQLMIAGFKMRISPEKLASFYRNHKKLFDKRI